MLLHYLTTKSGILKGSDISEIAIVFSYICYMLLYIKVLSLRKQGEVKSLFKGVICPVLGLAGSLIILIGGLISNPFYVACFIIFCGLVCLSGALYYKGRSAKKY
jgi:APA family basic amino acid/polyamine antiporter